MDRIADYVFVRPLNQGNYGDFYQAATPSRLGVAAEFVTVKVLAASTSGEAFKRATKELRAFSKVHSPFLVTLYDAGQEGDRFYYSMEYLPLGTLAAPARALERGEILAALADASRAAHALHEAGLAHRDIEPANILLHEGGAKLSDLGLAQLLQPGLTVTSVGPIGAVEYMDPSILHGSRASRASDIWSLGVTLHRALTGTGVFGELPPNDPLLAVSRVLNTRPVISGTLSPAEVAVLESCLAPDPADRYPTADALAYSLDELAK